MFAFDESFEKIPLPPFYVVIMIITRHISTLIFFFLVYFFLQPLHFSLWVVCYEQVTSLSLIALLNIHFIWFLMMIPSYLKLVLLTKWKQLSIHMLPAAKIKTTTTYQNIFLYLNQHSNWVESLLVRSWKSDESCHATYRNTYYSWNYHVFTIVVTCRFG